MQDSIVLLPGDGIGPEVIGAARRVLEACSLQWDLGLSLSEFPIGGQALSEGPDPLPEATLDACLGARAVLLGAVGDPRFDQAPVSQRPEQALLRLRRKMGLFANLRPIKVFESLQEASPLKPERVFGVDLLIVRELTGGIYFGHPRERFERDGVRVALDTEIYSDVEIERISRVAFEAARRRRRCVVSSDKANVLESSRLWREVVEEVARDYPDVELTHQLIDSCAMKLISDPREFDVLLTSNLFGDILSDEAAMITGSIGMLPSASFGAQQEGAGQALYEPVHGSAPDIAGTDSANPLAAIGCVAMLCRHSLGRADVAEAIDRSIELVLNTGFRTPDLSADRGAAIGTGEMTDAVIEQLKEKSEVRSQKSESSNLESGI